MAEVNIEGSAIDVRITCDKTVLQFSHTVYLNEAVSHIDGTDKEADFEIQLLRSTNRPTHAIRVSTKKTRYLLGDDQKFCWDEFTVVHAADAPPTASTRRTISLYLSHEKMVLKESTISDSFTVADLLRISRSVAMYWTSIWRYRESNNDNVFFYNIYFICNNIEDVRTQVNEPDLHRGLKDIVHEKSVGPEAPFFECVEEYVWKPLPLIGRFRNLSSKSSESSKSNESNESSESSKPSK